MRCQERTHRGARAGADFQYLEIGPGQNGVHDGKQPPEIRGRVRRLLMRVRFVASVKRSHRGSHLFVRHCACQFAVERVAAGPVPGGAHFCAYTTNPSGNFVRLDLNCATSGFSRFRTTRLRPPALMISQIT